MCTEVDSALSSVRLIAMAISNKSTAGEKPVVVRVKRKSWHSRLDAFWLEINERPRKRPPLDFEKLSIGDDSSAHGQADLKTKKVFVKHVETVGSLEDAIDVVQLFTSNCADAVEGKPEAEEQRTFNKDNKKEQLLSESRKIQEVLAQNARFDQIWSNQRGNDEEVHDKLREICHFYDIIRVNVEEGSDEVQERESMSVENQRILSSHIPLPKDYVSSAIAEIESDICAYLSEQGYDLMPRSVADIESDIRCSLSDQGDYVYDYYTMKDDMDVDDEAPISPYPLIKVEDDEDFYDGVDDELENDSDDSNAEAHPDNDYPNETSEEENEMESETSNCESSSGGEDKEEEEQDSDGASRVSELEDLSEDVAASYKGINYDYNDNNDYEDDYNSDYDYINGDQL